MTEKPVRILVTGSREWTDDKAVRMAIAARAYGRLDFVTIVHGDCQAGADRFARRFCEDAGIREERHPADWDTHGKAAGMRRNAEMASLGADMCLAFWDGKSRGTEHMIRCCVECGIPVHITPKARGK